jgi:Domain of unknown function (DUF4386)
VTRRTSCYTPTRIQLWRTPRIIGVCLGSILISDNHMRAVNTPFLSRIQSALLLTYRSSRILGAAFLFQAVASLISGIILDESIVSGNTVQSINNIANNPLAMDASIAGELITAAGIIFLGVILFATLREQSEKTALVALGLYILEALILAASRIPAFALIKTSEQYVTTGHPASFASLASSQINAMNFGYSLALVPFGFGAVLFYYLIYRTRIVPRPLSLYGLVTVSLLLIGTLIAISGYPVSNLLYYPYAPFEFIIGAWILVRGTKMPSEISRVSKVSSDVIA